MSLERSTNSVLQGETLSPKLFTLFVEDIVSFLEIRDCIHKTRKS
jgi:hypothetical protein